MTRRAFRQAARAQRVCAITGRAGGFLAHHIVRENDVPAGRDPHDTRNALRVSHIAHLDHHARSDAISVLMLPDEALDYAFEILGPYAYDYLHRHYPGEDPRLEARLVLASGDLG